MIQLYQNAFSLIKETAILSTAKNRKLEEGRVNSGSKGRF
jgi:hypothetical protein